MRKKERFVLGKRTFRSQKSKHFVLRIINDFGRWTVSGNLEEFMSLMQYMSEDGNRRVVMGRNGYDFLMNNWTVEHTYNSIMRHFRS